MVILELIKDLEHTLYTQRCLRVRSDFDRLLHDHHKDSGQAVRTPRLIRVFDENVYHFVDFVTYMYVLAQVNKSEPG